VGTKTEPSKYCLTIRQQWLAMNSTKLVHFLVRRYFCRRGDQHDQDYQDYVGSGLVALARAAALYDPGRGIKFSTYASNSIYNACLRHRELEMRERGCTNYVLAADDEGETIGLDALPDRRGVEDEYERERREQRETVERLLSDVSERVRWAIELRYYQGQTLAQVGAELGVTAERARQLIRNSLRWVQRREEKAAGVG
jgi:RNA polymerase sigma factor (sigma-70 family)